MHTYPHLSTLCNIFICMYTSIHTYTDAYIPAPLTLCHKTVTYMYIYTRIYRCSSTAFLYICIRMPIYVYIYVYIYARIYRCSSTAFLYICIRIPIRIYLFAHIPPFPCTSPTSRPIQARTRAPMHAQMRVHASARTRARPPAPPPARAHTRASAPVYPLPN